MEMDALKQFALAFLEVSALLLTFTFGVIVLAVICMYIADVTQKSQTIRRNYPVIGRFRYFFEHLGEFFRQYFFALDREEMPFNRAERDWIDDVSKHGGDNVPFGSTKVLSPGTALFANGMFPKLEGEHIPDKPLVIGPDTPNPYAPTSFFNISAIVCFRATGIESATRSP